MVDASPRDIVGLQIKDMEQQPDEYKVQLDENPPGTFTAEGCVYAKMKPCNKAEFVCIGRYN